MKTALGHIKVLDLSRVLAGPWATQNLADMGAEVIKIERPRVGDDTRTWGPPFLKDADGVETRDSSYFLSANRGKKSVTVDLATAEGQDIIRMLVRDVDVLVENYKVGTLARYGLAYDDLKAINPRLVYCSVTGFGQDGPYAALPGYDYVFQGMGGLMSLTGVPDGEPGGAPMKTGLAITDLLTGMYATSAILAALEHRHISGAGQYIDMSLLDCIVAINSYQALNYFLSGKIPQRVGNAHPNMVPYQVFHCKEGDLIIAVGNDSQYAAYCRAIGREHLATDPMYSTGPQRNRNRATLIPLLAEAMQAKTCANGSRCWSRKTCPAARSTTWRKCSRIRRSAIAICTCRCRTALAWTRPASPTRSACRIRRSNTRVQRPSWASTTTPSFSSVSACRMNGWQSCGPRALFDT